MLAHPTKSLSEVLDRFEGHNFTCEFKYDGERAQVSLDETILNAGTDKLTDTSFGRWYARRIQS